MLHPTKIARVILASITVAAVALVAFAGPAGAWPILEGKLGAAPSSGRAGSMVLLQGSKFFANEDVSVSFWDRDSGVIVGGAMTDGLGRFQLMVCVPWNAIPGADLFAADSTDKRVEASATFIVLAPRKASGIPQPSSRQSAQTSTHVPRASGGLGRTATDIPELSSGGGGVGSPDSICV